MDRGLQYAVDSCLRRYVQAGGERFDYREEVTTTAAGRHSFSLMPVHIAGVSLMVGGRPYRIQATAPEDRARDCSSSKTLEIRWVKPLTIPSTTTHPLIGSGATAGNTFPAFDDWVCATAARYLALKDGEPMPLLDQLWADVEATIKSGPPIPRMKRFPSTPKYWETQYSWFWDPSGKYIQVCSRF